MEFSQIYKSYNYHPARITKADEDFAKKLDFKGIKFPVKIRDKIERKDSIGINVFCYENKEKHPTYVFKKNMLIYY